MPVITTYACDNCPHKQNNPEQMWHVGVYVKPCISPSSGQRAPQLWCRMCVEKLCLLPPVGHEKKKKAIPPKPTFEEVIRELVQDMIEECQ